MAAKKVRVLVVEDQPKLLKNLQKLLSKAPEVEVCGSAMTGQAAIAEAEKLRPEILLLDLGLPDIDGIEVTKRVRAADPKVEVLIFTVFDEEDKVLGAVKAGAGGYLLKGAPVEKIVEAIVEVSQGGSVIQPSLARKLLTVFQTHAQAASGVAGEPTPSLTPRETEILQLIAKGLSNAEAAGVLKLSRATVRTHLEHIYAKLSVTNRVEAVTEGIRQGLIEV
ncbi:MAG: response regulator transcription factor [Deltaproteobacteria bacterium]|nr:response regulator transcription factor [Deltaproteobacteria bacterium]